MPKKITEKGSIRPPGRMCNPFVPVSIVRFDKLIFTFSRSTRPALIAFGFGLFALEIGIFRCC